MHHGPVRFGGKGPCDHWQPTVRSLGIDPPWVPKARISELDASPARVRQRWCSLNIMKSGSPWTQKCAIIEFPSASSRQFLSESDVEARRDVGAGDERERIRMRRGKAIHDSSRSRRVVFESRPAGVSQLLSFRCGAPKRTRPSRRPKPLHPQWAVLNGMTLERAAQVDDDGAVATPVATGSDRDICVALHG
jgi:hypothetical protein